LAAIAKELNIGTDAIVFFDDSPVEREWVRSQMPEVTVIEVPESPLDFARSLEESGAFDHLTILAEDRRRPEIYKQQQERRRLQTQSISLEEFLKQLNMTATVGYVSKETLPRVAQLLAKTNQFNLTTRRHEFSELQVMIDSGAVALWVRVSDRFGDNGLVGVAIAIPENPSRWLIDTFLLSCRVIGRQVERVLLSMLVRSIRERDGLEILGEYIPTAKNGVAADLYQLHGFTGLDDIGRYWVRKLAAGDIAVPSFVTIDFADENIMIKVKEVG
jgi:FkbH-like protein